MKVSQSAAILALLAYAGDSYALGRDDSASDRISYGNSNVTNFMSSVGDYVEEHKSLTASVASAADSTDLGSRREIDQYYKGVNKKYLEDPLRPAIDNFNLALTEYVEGVSNAVDSFSGKKSVNSGKGADKDDQKKDREETNDAKGCFRKFANKLNDAGDDLLEQTHAAYDIVSDEKRLTVQQSRRIASSASWNGSSSKKTNIFDRSAARDIDGCCDFTNDGPKDRCDELKNKIIELQRNFKKNSFSLDAPVTADPIRDGVPPADLNRLLSTDLKSKLLRARQKGVDSEIEAFEKGIEDCEKAKKAKLSHSLTPLGTAVEALANFGVCQMAPFLGATYGTLGVQRMTSSLSAFNLQTSKLDIQCDPAMQAFWNQQRDQAMAQINKDFVDMRNPSYIARLKATLAPIPPTFPHAAGPNGEVITPYAVFGATGNNAMFTSFNNTNGSIALAPSRSATALGTRTDTSGRIAPSRSTGVRAAFISPSANSRGTVLGAQLALSARTLSTNISSGRDALSSAAQLRSGVANTLGVARTMVFNNRNLTATQRRALSAVSAARAQSVANAVAVSRSSRIAAQGALNSISAPVTPTSPYGNYYPSGTNTAAISSLTNLNGNLTAQSQRMEQLAQVYLTNMDSSRTKGNALLGQIDTLLIERDTIIDIAQNKVQEMAPRDAYKVEEQTRRALLAKDREISSLKLQFEIYSASVQEQAAMLQTVAAFGVKNGSAAAFGQAGNALPTNFPQVSVGGTPTSNGGSRTPVRSTQINWNSLFERFANFADPFKAAYAATTRNLGIFANEKDWLAAWDKFQGDYKNYVDFKVTTEKASRKAAAEAMNKQNDTITEKTVRDTDTETLTAMQIYVDSVEEELGDLIASDDNNDANEVVRSIASTDPKVKSILLATRTDVIETQKALAELALQYRDSYPLSTDDNPEVWWEQVPSLLLY